jgi:hypothetical protein
MCQDCPTKRDRAKGVGRELAADLLLPFILVGVVYGTLLLTGTLGPL